MPPSYPPRPNGTRPGSPRPGGWTRPDLGTTPFPKKCLQSYSLQRYVGGHGRPHALDHPVRRRAPRPVPPDPAEDPDAAAGRGPRHRHPLAQELTLNTGATSYHLRQLAEHGFIVEDTERGDARDRWWRAAHESTRANLDRPARRRGRRERRGLPADVALLYTETLMQHVGERRYLPEPWQRASTTSDWHLRLTAARAEQLVDTLADLVEQWTEEEDGHRGRRRLRGQPQRVPAAGHRRPGRRPSGEAPERSRSTAG